MRVALTGASGFTGRFVIDALNAQGATCVTLDADLRDRAAVNRAIDAVDFDHLIHLAGRAFVDAVDWPAFYDVNQLGTLNLLDAMARARPGARCILASSAQVYGSGSEGLIDESTVARPSNHYAVSKRAMEICADLWRDRLDIVVTRPFNYTGVGQGIEYLLPKLVYHFRCRAKIIELGNTWVKRDFCDVRSVAQVYAGLIAAETVPPIVNICTGQLYSIDQILAILLELSGHAIEIQVNPAFVRANDVPVLGGNAALLHSVLPNWAPQPLVDTLAWMYNQQDDQSDG